MAPNHIPELIRLEDDNRLLAHTNEILKRDLAQAYVDLAKPTDPIPQLTDLFAHALKDEADLRLHTVKPPFDDEENLKFLLSTTRSVFVDHLETTKGVLEAFGGVRLVLFRAFFDVNVR